MTDDCDVDGMVRGVVVRDEVVDVCDGIVDDDVVTVDDGGGRRPVPSRSLVVSTYSGKGKDIL